MSIPNIGTAAGFAAATVSPAAQLLGELTGIDPKKWDITEATFISNQTLAKSPTAKPVRFLVFQTLEPFSAGLSEVHDSVGRRNAVWVFPYRDGQTTDDLGRKGETVELNCLFFGNNYRQAMDRLFRELNQPSPGVLRHPVRGDLPVKIADARLTHTHEQRKAVAVNITFIEHTFTIDSVSKQAPGKDSTIKSALLAAYDAVKNISAAITKVQSVVFTVRNLKAQITAALNTYSNLYVAVLQSLNSTFNDAGSVDLPALLPVNEGGLGDNKGGTTGTTFPIVNSASDPFTAVAQATTAAEIQAVATNQAVDQVNSLRTSIGAIINQLSTAEDGQGALIFHDEILSLKRTAILMQNVLETGISSSRSQIVSFTTPRLMSIREVAFAVGLDVNLSYEIELLNPSILSSNFIEKGTTLQVPTK